LIRHELWELPQAAAGTAKAPLRPILTESDVAAPAVVGAVASSRMVALSGM